MHLRALLPALALPLCGLALGGCGAATSTAGFKGEQHEVAQAVANFQSAASAGEGSKICADYLDKSIVDALGASKGCESAIKHQLAQVDNLEITIESVKLGASGRTATVSVKSIYYGKDKLQDLALVKEDGAWKLSGP